MSSHERTAREAFDQQKTGTNAANDRHSQQAAADSSQSGLDWPSVRRNSLIELSMIFSMALYYVVGNPNIPYTGFLAHINPLVSTPFLLVFVALCWYRLPFAVALLPLTLPFYLLPKEVIPSANFSLAEITLLVCAGVAGVQVILWQTAWRYWLSPRELRDRIGPFGIVIILFVAAALVSSFVAYDQHVAIRYLRELVIEPLIYLLLILYTFRSRRDMLRLAMAFLATAFLIGLLGLVQYFFFRYTLKPDVDGLVRIAAVFGSANDLGILFDFTIPFAMAFVLVDTSHVFGNNLSRWLRVLAVIYCLFALAILYLIQSLGTWAAMAVAVVFLAAVSVRSKKTLLVGTAVCVVALLVGVVVFHTKITNFLFTHHLNASGVSTTTKRLYLWLAALHMFRDYPLFGVGLNNWLCHYSVNTICNTPQLHHYWVLKTSTGVPTGVADEPTLSHPHNDILNVAVSLGIFGLLAYLAAIILFFWTFVRIVMRMRAVSFAGNDALLWWMLIGAGTAFLAGLVQGQFDSAFLKEDTSYFFWALVAALLWLRSYTATPWRGRVSIGGDKGIQAIENPEGA